MKALFVTALTAGLSIGDCITIIPGPTVCTDQFVYGISVTLLEENGGDPITNAVLTLRDGSYTEVMDEVSDGVYVGAGERAGSYTLTIEKAGFEDRAIGNLVVAEDECHVIPLSRTYTLQDE